MKQCNDWSKSGEVIEWLRQFDSCPAPSGIVCLAGHDAVRAVRAARAEVYVPQSMQERAGERREADVRMRRENAELRSKVNSLELEVFRLQGLLKRAQEAQSVLME